jgi:uncharacterized membrane protein YeaQ/YmgE (transglycosylase-associated protein family)
MFDTLVAVITSPINCILWIIVGAVAGALARRIMGSPNYPLFQDIILGLLGAAFGGILASFVVPDVFATGGLNLVLVNLVVATIGASILIAIRRAIKGRK